MHIVYADELACCTVTTSDLHCNNNGMSFMTRVQTYVTVGAVVVACLPSSV